MLWLRTVNGPIVRAERLASLSVLYSDGHHVDFDRPVTWRDEIVYVTAFFDYLEYGMPIAACHVEASLEAMHSLMSALDEAEQDNKGSSVLGAVPNSEPVRWERGTFLPPLSSIRQGRS